MKVWVKWWHDDRGGWEFLEEKDLNDYDDPYVLRWNKRIYCEVDLDEDLLKRYELACKKYDSVCEEIDAEVKRQNER